MACSPQRRAASVRMREVEDVLCSVYAERQRKDSGRRGGGGVEAEGGSKAQNGFGCVGGWEVEA